MIFVLDNYDSFTYNLVQRLGEIDASLDIQVARNDQTSIDQIEALGPERIIISPGPCTPSEAGLSKEVVAHFADKLPVMGVCLGHQCMAEVFGGEVVRADRLMHGKVSEIHHDNQGLFANLPNPFTATRYHSLIVPEDSFGEDIEICAWTEDADHPRELMGFRHKEHQVHAVQFHPESYLTDAGIQLLKNFLALPAVASVS
ncbi:MAG: anthranilate/aminodeoxychorismate synthase component II [Planctomycetaceae bacterium]|nr:anthranilate/aminodeoxychorismate synthase component II [Planctomycetaceae bacterium]